MALDFDNPNDEPILALTTKVKEERNIPVAAEDEWSDIEDEFDPDTLSDQPVEDVDIAREYLKSGLKPPEYFMSDPQKDFILAEYEKRRAKFQQSRIEQEQVKEELRRQMMEEERTYRLRAQTRRPWRKS